MDIKKIDHLFAETAYVRMGGSDEELKCAEYLKAQCEELGMEAHLEEFEVAMATMKHASLVVDGEEIPCKGYFNCGSHEIEAPFYYLRADDAYSLSQCKDKIVMVNGYMGYWLYRDIVKNGAVGFITYDGNANYIDEDIDQRELREILKEDTKVIPGVNINAKRAIELVKNNAKTVKMVIEQDEYKGLSHNVVAYIPGEVDETIVCTAHYDSTSLSEGAYDNMSGSIGLLGIAEKFMKAPHKYGLTFVFCGSEERGLLGSKAYVEAHKEELDKIVLNVNLDMIGCIMGHFLACCTTEEKLVHFMEYFCKIQGFDMKARQDVYSSDSTPFADKGVPALSFCRWAPTNTATIHNSYDTAKVMSAVQMQKDIDFIISFVDAMANAKLCPVAREIPENMKEKLDIYNCRKRDTKK